MPASALDAFLTQLRSAAPQLAAGLEAGEGLTAAQRTELGDLLTRFLAGADGRLARELTVAAFARAFIAGRVFAQGAQAPGPLELPELDRRMQGVFSLVFPNDGSDLEYALAGNVLELLALERAWASPPGPSAAQRERWATLSAALLTVPEVYRAMLAGSELEGIRGLLDLVSRWLHARAKYTHALTGWACIPPPYRPARTGTSKELELLAEVWLQLTLASAAS